MFLVCSSCQTQHGMHNPDNFLPSDVLGADALLGIAVLVPLSWPTSRGKFARPSSWDSIRMIVQIVGSSTNRGTNEGLAQIACCRARIRICWLCMMQKQDQCAILPDVWLQICISIRCRAFRLSRNMSIYIIYWMHWYYSYRIHVSVPYESALTCSLVSWINIPFGIGESLGWKFSFNENHDGVDFVTASTQLESCSSFSCTCTYCSQVEPKTTPTPAPIPTPTPVAAPSAPKSSSTSTSAPKSEVNVDPDEQTTPAFIGITSTRLVDDVNSLMYPIWWFMNQCIPGNLFNCMFGSHASQLLLPLRTSLLNAIPVGNSNPQGNLHQRSPGCCKSASL